MKEDRAVSLEALEARMKNYAVRLDAALSRELRLYAHSRFHDPLFYATEGGKRVRPVMLMLSAEALGCKDDSVLGGGSALRGGHRVARGGKRQVPDHRLLFGVAAEASCPGVARRRWDTVRRKKVPRVAGRGLLDCSGTIRREMLRRATRRPTTGHAARFLTHRGDVRIFCALCQTSLSGLGISAFAHEMAARDN